MNFVVTVDQKLISIMLKTIDLKVIFTIDIATDGCFNK